MPLADFRSTHLVYCIQRQEEGGYLILNREYLPLGFVDRDRPWPPPIKWRITPSLAKKLSIDGKEDLDRIFLYNDVTIPTLSAETWKSYQGRLKALAALKRPRE